MISAAPGAAARQLARPKLQVAAHAAQTQRSRRGRVRCRVSPAPLALVQDDDAAPPLQIDSFGFRPGFDYEFDRGPMIGSGSFGVVHVARHIKTGQKYAVKSIPKVFGESYHLEPEFAARVFHEVDIARHMGQSLNVIHLVEAFEDDVNVDLVLELASGGSLWGRIQRGAVEEQQAASIIADVLRAVAQCHAKGVIIRDVKPDNFLFMSRRPTCPLKMVDFGLAQFCRPGEAFSERAGTPYYVAPEVVDQHYSLPADVWSTGVTAYQLLSGRLPWANDPEWVGAMAGFNGASGLGASTAARLAGPDGPNVPSGVLWRAIQSAELDFTWPPWDDISGGARDLVQSMLQRDPSLRPTAAELLHHPWLARTAACRTCWNTAATGATAGIGTGSHNGHSNGHSSSSRSISNGHNGAGASSSSSSGGGVDCNACAAQAMAGTSRAAGRGSSISNGNGNGRHTQEQEQEQAPLGVLPLGAVPLSLAAMAAAAAGSSSSSNSNSSGDGVGDGDGGSSEDGGGVPLYLQPLEDSLVQRLQRYGTFSRLKQVALRHIVGVMAPSPHPPCLAVYAAHFNTLLDLAAAAASSSGSGGGASGGSSVSGISSGEVAQLPASRLVELLSSDAWDLSDVEVNMLVSQFDLDHDGCVDLYEWLSALIDWPLAQQHPQWAVWLRQVFDEFDADGDGVISAQELLASLTGPNHAGWSELDGVVDDVTPGGLPPGDYIMPDAVRSVLRHADTNHDGVLSFQEFEALVTTNANDQLDLFPSRRCADSQPLLLHAAAGAGSGAARHPSV